MKNIILLFALLSSFSLFAADCSESAERAAVEAAQNEFNPEGNESGVQVSKNGNVYEAKSVSKYRKFYIVNVSDEVGESFWTVAVDSRCNVLKIVLALEE